jgi:hypothetical protein
MRKWLVHIRVGRLPERLRERRVHCRGAMCKAGLNPAGDAGFIDFTSGFLQVCSGPQIQHTPDLCKCAADLLATQWGGPMRCQC